MGIFDELLYYSSVQVNIRLEAEWCCREWVQSELAPGKQTNRWSRSSTCAAPIGLAAHLLLDTIIF